MCPVASKIPRTLSWYLVHDWLCFALRFYTKTAGSHVLVSTWNSQEIGFVSQLFCRSAVAVPCVAGHWPLVTYRSVHPGSEPVVSSPPLGKLIPTAELSNLARYSIFTSGTSISVYGRPGDSCGKSLAWNLLRFSRRQQLSGTGRCKLAYRLAISLVVSVLSDPALRRARPVWRQPRQLRGSPIASSRIIDDVHWLTSTSCQTSRDPAEPAYDERACPGSQGFGAIRRHIPRQRIPPRSRRGMSADA